MLCRVSAVFVCVTCIFIVYGEGGTEVQWLTLLFSKKGLGLNPLSVWCLLVRLLPP